MQVGRLPKDRFLVVLPVEMNRDEVVAALPRKIWDEGFTLQPYSPLIDATISIPFFKIWVDIKGAPLELYTEAHMAKVISSFGVYLGSMEPRIVGDCQNWSIFLATDDLAQVPYHIDIRVGGMIHMAQVCPRKWTKGQVFKRSDLPPTPTPYRPPQELLAMRQKEAPTAPSFNPEWFQHDDVMPFSLTILREIFRHIPPEELPVEFAACLAGDAQAIAANHDAYRKWGGEEERWRRVEQIHNTQPTPRVAAPDPPQLAVLPTTAHQPTPNGSGSRTHASPTTTVTPATEATVRRTDCFTSRGKRTQPDLAMQVCAPDLNQTLGQKLDGWEPRDLFPEIHTPPPQTVNQNKSIGKRPCERIPTPKKTVTLCRTTRNRVNKKNSEKGGSIEIEVQDFVDVPLQHAEGREMLALIGAGNIPIPSHIVFSSQQHMEAGQPSKAPNKKKKQAKPSKDPSGPRDEQIHSQEEATQGLRPNRCVPLHNSEAQHTGSLEHSQKGDDIIGEEIPSEDVVHQDDSVEPNPLIEHDEDPYLDQVDYSDEDPPQ